MLLYVVTKQRNIYQTLAIEVINNGKDIRFHSIIEAENVYVIVSTDQVEDIYLA